MPIPLATGVRLIALRRRSARPTPRPWRAPAAASAGRSGSRRSVRPPGAAGAAAPGCRAGQSLRDAAADRRFAAGARRRACLRRGAGAPRRGRASACRASRPARAEMAERSAARRQEVRRHPDRRREARRPSPSASGSIACIIRSARPFRPPISPRRACAPRRTALFAALSAAMIGRLAQWNRGAGFRGDPRRLAQARRRSRRSRSACDCRKASCAGRFESVDDAGRLVLRRADGDAPKPSPPATCFLRSVRA